MADIINLLPDSLANQIAAGEVVQRPASVVKELLENSIDAGADRITLTVSDGGRAGILVVDNGAGMSATDARLCFERHATSKIRESSDLEAITTMGFRGEALASIAAVAEVTLTTRRAEDEIGLRITLSGSRVTEQTPMQCAKGASFSVRNLFFNVPARRRFLKSTSVEMKHIVAEFQRVAIANPTVAMSLVHDGNTIYNLASANRYQRIVGLFGKRIETTLIPMSVVIDSLAIEGYIGKPDSARVRGGEQFLYVNGRFMRNPYFNRAIVAAYGKLIAPDTNPIFFLHFAVPPGNVDVNVHPTKTEVKFQDERLIWQMLHAGVREALGKYGGVPLIDFETAATVDVPFYPPSAPLIQPEIAVDTSYNPFDDPPVRMPSRILGSRINAQGANPDDDQYQFVPVDDSDIVNPSLYDDPTAVNPSELPPAELISPHTIQFRASYIIAEIRSGLVIIDQHRAHARILYEELANRPPAEANAKHLLFPVTMQLAPLEMVALEAFIPEAKSIGLLLEPCGDDTITLQALPADLTVSDPEAFVHEMLAQFGDEELSLAQSSQHRHLAAVACASAMRRGVPLQPEVRTDLVRKLFACREPARDPYLRPTLHVIPEARIADMLSASRPITQTT